MVSSHTSYFIDVLFFIHVFIIKPEHCRVDEGIQSTAFLLSRSARATCTVYKSTNTTHLKQFVLLGICHILVNLRNKFGTYTLLYSLQYLERVGYRRFLYTNHLASLNRMTRFDVYIINSNPAILAGIGSNGASLIYARSP